nr:MAG TPA: hypothetical protein [Caudoviricetes sp.]
MINYLLVSFRELTQQRWCKQAETSLFVCILV